MCSAFRVYNIILTSNLYDTTVNWNIGEAYNYTTTVVTGYDYANSYLDTAGASQTGDVQNFIPVLSDAGKDITLLYDIKSYTITVDYEDRNGGTVAPSTTATADHFSSYTAADPAPSNYVLVDWKLNGGALQGNTTPTINPVTGTAAITLIYGQDANGNNIEDVTFNIKHEVAPGGTAVQNAASYDTTATWDVGSPYTYTATSVTGYTYSGTYLDTAGASQSGNVSFTPSYTDAGKDITLLYDIKSYTITVDYEDRSGGTVAPSTTAAADHFSSYTAADAAPAGYVLVDWKLNNTIQGNTNPTVNPVTGDTTITLIYGQDANGNNIEDVTFNIKHEAAPGGTAVQNAASYDQSVTWDVGTAYTYTAPSITGYDYSGGYLDTAGGSQTGNVSFTPAYTDAGKDVILLYDLKNYTITVNYEDRSGGTVAASTSATVDHFDSFTATDPAPSGYVLVDWKLDGALQGNTNPTINPVTGPAAVTLIYGRDGNGNGKEEFTVTRKWLLDGTTAITGLADTTVDLDVGDHFNLAYDNGPTAAQLDGYTYQGYKLDGGSLQAGNPDFPIDAANGDREVIYVLTKTGYSLTVRHVDRAGNVLDSNPAGIIHGDPFTAQDESISDMVYVGWYIGTDKPENSVINATGSVPHIPSVDVTHNGITITLVYGKDKVMPDGTDGSDGIEDFTVTRKWKLQTSGNSIGIADADVDLNVGQTFALSHTAGVDPAKLVGYTYQGYTLDGGPLQTGADPSFAVSKDHEVVYVYTRTTYTMTVRYVGRDGVPLDPNTNPSATHGDSFTAADITISGKIYVGWYIGTNTPANSTINDKSVTPHIASVTGAETITLVYGNNLGGDPNKEDFKVTAYYLSDDAAAITVKPSDSEYVDVGAIYDFPANRDAGVRAGYTYVGYKYDTDSVSDPIRNDTPAMEIKVPADGSANGDRSITYYYAADEQNVIVKYVNEAENAIPGKSDYTAAPRPVTDSTYAPGTAVTDVPGYTLVDWKLSSESGWRGDANPTITVPDGGATIILKYRADGQTVTVDYENETGGAIPGKSTYTVSPDPATDSTYAPDSTVKNVPGYTLVDWKLSTEGGWRGDANPSITVPAGGANIILKYQAVGQDVVIKYEDENGNAISGKADVTVTPKPKTDDTYTPDSALTTVPGYTFTDWKVDGEPGWRGDTNPSITVPAGGATIVLRYTAEAQSVKVQFVDKTNNTLQSEYTVTPAPVTNSTFAPNLSDPAYAIADYMVIGWKLAGETAWQTGAPSATVPAGGLTMVLRYGHDQYNGTTDTPGSDGIEDIRVSMNYVDQQGVSIQSGSHKDINLSAGAKFNEAAPAITGYASTGRYKVDNGPWQTGTPDIALDQDSTDFSVTYEYRILSYTITVKYEDRAGNEIQTQKTYSVNYGTANWQPTDLSVPDYVFVDWKLDSGGLVGDTNPVIANVTGEATITLVFGQDKGGPNDKPDGIEDFTITVSHVTQTGGGKIAPDQEVYVNKGDPFTGSALNNPAFTVVDVQWDNVSEAVTNPVVKNNIQAEHTLVFVYTPNSYPENVKYQTADGTTLAADQNELIVHGSDFTKSSNPALKVEGIPKKTLINWSLDGVMQNNTNPGLTNVTRYHDIVLVYGQDENGDGKEDVTITEEFYGPNGSIAGSRTVYVNKGEAYNGTPAAIAGFTYKDYQVDGGAKKTGSPAIANVQKAYTVRMLYTVSEHTITEVYLCNNGCNELQRNTVKVTYGNDYSANLKDIPGHTYKEYRVDQGSVQAGGPSIVNVQGDHTIYFYYVHKTYTVDIKLVDDNGKSIGNQDYSQSKGWHESVSVTPPTIAGYQYQSWKLDGAGKNGAVSLKNIEAGHVITLVYQAAAKEEPKDDNSNDNYEFIKKPNIKDVAAGQTVDYTFTGFGNKWPVKLERYAISDIPDKGLDFVSADLPAFTNGTGVTYDVIYTTNRSNGDRVLYAKVAADMAFSFKAPQLADGEYITALTLEFGTVPAGFAMGDSMDMTFRVWDNPPSGTLTNIGILGYRVNGKDKQFVTGGASGSITIDGYFTYPKTGDAGSMALPVALMGSSFAGIMFIMLFAGKKRKKKEKNA